MHCIILWENITFVFFYHLGTIQSIKKNAIFVTVSTSFYDLCLLTLQNVCKKLKGPWICNKSTRLSENVEDGSQQQGMLHNPLRLGAEIAWIVSVGCRFVPNVNVAVRRGSLNICPPSIIISCLLWTFKKAIILPLDIFFVNINEFYEY